MATNQSSSSDSETTKSIVSHVTPAPIAYHGLLTSIKFNGKNYLDWSRAVNIALGGRRLLGYITGETTEIDHSSHGDWKATDYLVMSLIIETMAPELSRSFLGAKTAKEMWLAIRSTYSHKEDVTKRLEIKKRIRRCMQGNRTVQEYYSQFIGLWDELKECEKAVCPTCAVIANEEREENMIVSFLNGLNSEYESVRSNIFGQITLPSLGAVYSIILGEEIRRGLVEKVETVCRMLYHGGRGRGKILDEKDKLKCSHCGKSRHTREGCWDLIGKPRNFGRGRNTFTFNASSDSIPQIGVRDEVESLKRQLVEVMSKVGITGPSTTSQDSHAHASTHGATSSDKSIIDTGATDHYSAINFMPCIANDSTILITLAGVVSLIFQKALMEPTFCEMYADLCSQLALALPDFSVNNEKITFKRLLLNRCQEEFERGEREEAEAAKEDEGELKQTPEEREEKKLESRRRKLGNIRLLGELYKKRMLTERIMHECIKQLLGPTQNPDEEDIEALCELMSTIGEMIDHVKAKEHMDSYFDLMLKLSNNQKYSSRVRFMLKDTMDLRKNRWQQRWKVEGPKKMEDVHRDAANERRVPLLRSVSREESLTLGPRGGLRRGMSIRGQPPIIGSGPSGSNGSRLASPDERCGPRLGRWSSSRNLERNFSADSSTSRPISVPSPQAVVPPVPAVSQSGGTSLPDSVVKEKSISSIREYFSARSEEEVKFCIADMNSPGSYQLIISTWINDSFERKELERDLTYKLLISLCNPKQGLFTQSHLLRGFEGVLSTLEDAVNDAPKAPEYLGQLFAKSITEGLTSLKDIGTIVLQGGEEPGMLIEAGIGGDVIGCVLECVRKDKGEDFLGEVRAKSELNLEEFKPALPMRSKKLDPFLLG